MSVGLLASLNPPKRKSRLSPTRVLRQHLAETRRTFWTRAIEKRESWTVLTSPRSFHHGIPVSSPSTLCTNLGGRLLMWWRSCTCWTYTVCTCKCLYIPDFWPCRERPGSFFKAHRTACAQQQNVWVSCCSLANTWPYGARSFRASFMTPIYSYIIICVFFFKIIGPLR